MEKKEIKVIELFAGVGGFRIGLEGYKGMSPISQYKRKMKNKINFKVIYSNQWEPSTKCQHASKVYEKRFGKIGHFNCDISEIKCNELKEKCDLLVGGFPCQDYSVANSLKTAKGLKGKKGVLWWEIERIIRELGSRKPQFLLLENVDRLLKSPVNNKGRDFSIMGASLNDLGYTVEWKVINAAEYGFPQKRRRVFIFCYLKKTNIYKKRKMSSIKDWILTKSVFAKAFPSKSNEDINTYQINGTLEIISKLNHAKNNKSIFLNNGICENRTITTINTEAKKIKIKSLAEILRDAKDIENEFWIHESDIKKWEDAKKGGSKERTSKSGFKYNFSEGRMPFPDKTEDPARTIITSEGGKSPSRFKHIISQNGRYRRLTTIELEKLNLFPDDFTNIENITSSKRAFLMGNALVVGIVEKIGREIAEQY